MNTFGSIRGIWVVALVLMLAIPEMAYAQAAPAVERVHYWNGDSKVQLDMALDELSLTPDTKRVPGVSQRDVPAELSVMSVGLNGDLLVRMDAPTAEVAALNAKAVELRGRGFKADAVLYAPGRAERHAGNRRVLGNTFSVRLKDGDTLPDVLAHYDLEVVREISYSPDTYILRSTSEDLLAALEVANALYEGGEAVFATPLLRKQQFTRAAPNDEEFSEQWHLLNTGQATGAVAGNDVNIVGAWDSVTGAGINIAVTDSGVETGHPDFVGNIRTDIDIDINGNDNDPNPESSSHGTGAAGIAAAKGNNTIGVAGSGYDAGIVGIRLIEAQTSDAEEAEAMNHQVDPANATDRVHINTNSWGPADSGQQKATFGPLTKAAIENGIANGRGGLGTIYTWAAGNGRQNEDNVNYDGYASSRYTIAVGASGGDGTFSYYSEPGASMLVTAPSSYGSVGTTTTTTGGGYTNGFGGTSSACPLVAGVVALMLEANPSLTWRDVQHILVDTSDQIDLPNGFWITNGSGRVFSHGYGFGRVNATAAVNAASTWTNVPAETTPLTNSESPFVQIPDNNTTGITRTLNISAPDGFFTEFVEVTFNATHTYRGHLDIRLTSPDGTQSILSSVHDDFNDHYSNWLFTSVAHWGEDPSGTWSLKVSDRTSGFTGSLTGWALKIHGHQEVVALDDVYVHFSNNGVEDGSSVNPFNTLAEALAVVTDSGTVHFQGGSSSETMTVDQSVTFQSAGSTAWVGVAP